MLNAAETFPDMTVQKVRVRNLPADEIRAFCKAKKRTVRTAKKMIPEGGDVWTFTALDSDSKLMVSWFNGDRDNRRLTRLINGFPKKLENHSPSLAVYFLYYNFYRIHEALKVTPAMQASVTDERMDISHPVRVIDAIEEPPKPGGSYRKRIAAWLGRCGGCGRGRASSSSSSGSSRGTGAIRGNHRNDGNSGSSTQ